MSRFWWFVILGAVGIGFIILVGVLSSQDDETKSEATSALCGSLKTLETSIETLVNIDTSTATKSEFQSDVDAVQTAWDQVKTDAGDVQDADTGDLDSAWDDFESAVKDVPDDASVQDAVSDVSQAADELESTAKSTASSITCS
jgi:hypothetical protein